jgi:hypothetical protein
MLAPERLGVTQLTECDTWRCAGVLGWLFATPSKVLRAASRRDGRATRAAGDYAARAHTRSPCSTNNTVTPDHRNHLTHRPSRKTCGGAREGNGRSGALASVNLPFPEVESHAILNAQDIGPINGKYSKYLGLACFRSVARRYVETDAPGGEPRDKLREKWRNQRQ